MALLCLFSACQTEEVTPPTGGSLYFQFRGLEYAFDEADMTQIGNLDARVMEREVTDGPDTYGRFFYQLTDSTLPTVEVHLLFAGQQDTTVYAETGYDPDVELATQFSLLFFDDGRNAAPTEVWHAQEVQLRVQEFLPPQSDGSVSFRVAVRGVLKKVGTDTTAWITGGNFMFGYPYAN
ncbi:MAG TPA: hypothetical protein DCE41_01180 [Cytophagales bacterium]|nr:hypothetical protein [Cytophagales bacterium]HAA17406.1 hypothetical protein [Cytophagales bacterium]HAP62031.1 hypothetical protein [Cytophagales bacterium]